MACEHEVFQGTVSVTRLSDVEDGPITGYTADVRICCKVCGVAFRFKGAPNGVSSREVMLSADGEELRAPIEPAYVKEVLGVPMKSGRA